MTLDIGIKADALNVKPANTKASSTATTNLEAKPLNFAANDNGDAYTKSLMGQFVSDGKIDVAKVSAKLAELNAQKNDDEEFDPSTINEDRALRPKTLRDYIGQEDAKKQLEIALEAAKHRGEALDHVLIFGPPGLGKTTLSNIIANEMGVSLSTTSGPALEKKGDVAALLTNLVAKDILFIDEIHRLSPVIEEFMYPAMEDYKVDILTGEGPSARSIKIGLNPFTLIGATTRAGTLTSPLRARFGIILQLQYYSAKELQIIITASAKKLRIPIEVDGAEEIAKRSRGTPRIANRLLRRVRDYAQVRGNGVINRETASQALDLLKIDSDGLDEFDRLYLKTIVTDFNGGPVGIESLAATLGYERDTLENVVEPYLIQMGYVQRGRTGRNVTQKAYDKLGLSYKEIVESRQGARGFRRVRSSSSNNSSNSSSFDYRAGV